MQINEKSAMIDNDFINKIVEMNKSDNDFIRVVTEVFRELNVDPAIHPLVLQNEVLTSNIRIQKMLDEQIVKTPAFKDIHKDDETKKIYYSFLVLELYKKLTGVELELGDKTVFTYWSKRSSLGEIHSLATCIICGCGVFLSDDKDSRKLGYIIEQSYWGHILVHSRQAVVNLLREKGTELSRKDLNSFSHV